MHLSNFACDEFGLRKLQTFLTYNFGNQWNHLQFCLFEQGYAAAIMFIGKIIDKLWTEMDADHGDEFAGLNMLL